MLEFIGPPTLITIKKSALTYNYEIIWYEISKNIFMHF